MFLYFKVTRFFALGTHYEGPWENTIIQNTCCIEKVWFYWAKKSVSQFVWKPKTLGRISD